MSQTPKNIYIRSVSLGRRKTCPTCHSKLGNEKIYSAGEYIGVNWRNVADYFCISCFDRLKDIINIFQIKNSRKVEILPYRGEEIPTWLTL